ncbi:MAG: hypothetical protein RJA36_599 [Pseudomonadota bacterium]|jgi:F0F1-type ATP synthase delta subunit
MALNLKHMTATQFAARLREAYLNGERARLVLIARFILARIAAADITDAQCRSAFSLSVAQWNALKAKMQAYIDADNTVRTAVGE